MDERREAFFLPHVKGRRARLRLRRAVEQVLPEDDVVAL
jgi:hypothetical protein